MGQTESEAETPIVDARNDNLKCSEDDKLYNVDNDMSDKISDTTSVNVLNSSSRVEGKQELDKIAGFQIVRLMPRSPAHHAGLVPYFDLIVALDGCNLNTSKRRAFSFFKKYMNDHVECNVRITVFSLYTRTLRDVTCKPNTEWGGEGLLGCSVEWAVASECVERCWHIVDILEHSPAWHCVDLIPEDTYLIGMQQPEESIITLLKSEQDLYERLDTWHSLQRLTLEALEKCDTQPINIPHVLLFLIYDRAINEVKEVLVEMSTQPDVPLGVRVAFGLLHHIPIASEPSSQLPVMRRFAICVNEEICDNVNDHNHDNDHENCIETNKESQTMKDLDKVAENNVTSESDIVNKSLVEKQHVIPVSSTNVHSHANVSTQKPQSVRENESASEENVTYGNEQNCAVNPFLDDNGEDEWKHTIEHVEDTVILSDVIDSPHSSQVTFPEPPSPLHYPHFFHATTTTTRAKKSVCL